MKKNIKDLGKLPKRTVTIDEVIGTSDISVVVDWVNKQKTEIQGMLVILMTDNGFKMNSMGLSESGVIHALEDVKLGVLLGEEDE